MNTTTPIVTNGNGNSSEEELELRRGPWTLEEDAQLIHYIACHGEGRWNLLAKCAGLKRTGKSCRLRWLNYLKPDIKRGNLTLQEQLLILELHSRWGNRWSKIAQHLPGRTDNEIKNYWRTRVQKQARQLKIDSNSKRFLEAIKRFWMPRLLEKMEQASALTPSMSSPTSAVLAAKEHSTIAASILPKQQDTLALASLQPSKQMDNPNDNDKSGSVTSTFVCSSSDYMALPNPPQLVSEAHPSSGPAAHAHALALANTNSIADYCYYMDMEVFDLPTTSATGTPDLSTSGCQIAESAWTGDEVADSYVWNMDELWQFRN